MTGRAAPEFRSVDAPVSSRARPHSLGGPGGPIPITFGPPETTCSGWFHPSRSLGRNVGIVICRPLGYEGNCAHDTCRELAEYLARAGFPVVRFDYHGTGNSPGGDADPNRVQAWLDSLRHAIAEVRRQGGVSQLSLVGIRLGATLAAHVASDRGGVESMVLWAPCVSGRGFARELRLSAANRDRYGRDTKNDLETMGYLYTAATLADLDALDLLRLHSPPAKRALIVGRDDLPGEGRLPAALRDLGVETTYRDWPGFAAMMTEPREGDVARRTIEAITEWLSTSHPPSSVAKTDVPPPAMTEPRTPQIVDGVRETPLVFGPKDRLFGVLSEPTESRESDPRRRVGVLMLSVGTNHQVGPNRMYVKMARALSIRGYRSLRFDLSGIGDSRAEKEHGMPRIYSKAAVADVRSAMDSMSRRGCHRFVLVGLCSGAYVAFQTALSDDRVTGQVLMNPRRLSWRAGDTLQNVMKQSYKSTTFYRKALFDRKTYMRLLHGEIDVRGIANRIRLLALARARRLFARALGRPPHEEDVLLNLKRLCSRGTDALFIVGEEDDGLDYLEFHLGSHGRNMRDHENFRMMFVERTDHTFSPGESLQKATAALIDDLDRRYGVPSRRGPTLVPAR